MDFRRSSTGAIAAVILIALGVFGTVLLIGFQNDGWTGYRLIDVDDIPESEDQLTQALRQHAAPVLR